MEPVKLNLCEPQPKTWTWNKEKEANPKIQEVQEEALHVLAFSCSKNDSNSDSIRKTVVVIS